MKTLVLGAGAKDAPVRHQRSLKHEKQSYPARTQPHPWSFSRLLAGVVTCRRPFYGSDADGDYEVVARGNEASFSAQGLQTQATNKLDALRFWVELRRYSGNRYKAVHIVDTGKQNQIYIPELRVRLFVDGTKMLQSKSYGSREYGSFTSSAGVPDRIYSSTGTDTYKNESTKYVKYVCAEARGRLGSGDREADGGELEKDFYEMSQEVCYLLKQKS